MSSFAKFMHYQKMSSLAEFMQTKLNKSVHLLAYFDNTQLDIAIVYVQIYLLLWKGFEPTSDSFSKVKIIDNEEEDAMVLVTQAPIFTESDDWLMIPLFYEVNKNDFQKHNKGLTYSLILMNQFDAYMNESVLSLLEAFERNRPIREYPDYTKALALISAIKPSFMIFQQLYLFMITAPNPYKQDEWLRVSGIPGLHYSISVQNFFYKFAAVVSDSPDMIVSGNNLQALESVKYKCSVSFFLDSMLILMKYEANWKAAYKSLFAFFLYCVFLIVQGKFPVAVDPLERMFIIPQETLISTDRVSFYLQVPMYIAIHEEDVYSIDDVNQESPEIVYDNLLWLVSFVKENFSGNNVIESEFVAPMQQLLEPVSEVRDIIPFVTLSIFKQFLSY